MILLLPKKILLKRVECGAKALSSKMAPVEPFGQFRRFHRKSMIFAFFWSSEGSKYS